MILSRICLLLAVGVLGASAADPVPPVLSTTNAPTGFNAVPPKGHLLLGGADAVAAGSPLTYQVSYLADATVVDQPLQVVVKRVVQIEKEEVNKQTGKIERKKIDTFTHVFTPFTPRRQAVEMIALPAFDREYRCEVYVAATASEKTEPLSNVLMLTRHKKSGQFMLPEAEEVVKTIAALPTIAATAKPLKPRQVLVFTRTMGYAHDVIPLGARAVALMGGKTGAWQATVSNDPFMFEPETLAQFDAIMMMNTTGSLFQLPDKAANARLRQSLLDFVEQGKGIAGTHAATDCSKDWKPYGALMGGYFVGHPFQFDKSTARFRNEDPTHPLTAAFKGEGFVMQDEMYTFGEPFARANQRVLISMDISTLKDDPARPGFKLGENRTDHDYATTWIREQGKGRVFYCALGHYHHIWWTTSTLQHYHDGMQYVLGDLPADATPRPARPAP